MTEISCAGLAYVYPGGVRALDDYTVVKLTRDSFHTTTIDNVPITPQIRPSRSRSASM